MSVFLKEWTKHQGSILRRMYPELSKQEINQFLENQIKKNLNNPQAKIHNNYIHKEIDVDLLGVIDWIDRTKVIIGGFGVFYKNQHEILNPAAVMLSNFLKLRKQYKKELHVYNEKSYEYATFDRLQLTEKINANSLIWLFIQ